ncbi:MAG: hypothetical protein ABIR79_24170, partial [Candidatus Binatia bacterium]
MCTFAWLARLSTPFPIHGDGIRDQMLVRDCTELGRCHLAGSPASIAGELRVFQGAAWLDLLTAVRILGGDTTTQIAVILALDAIAAAVTFIVVWRWLQPALALPAAYLLAGALAADPQSANLLANGSASPLFDVMTAAGLLCYAISNRTRFLLVSAFAAALAVNVHVAAVTLVPGLLLVSALGRAPYRDVVAAGTLFAAVYLVTSGAALEANLMALADRGLSFVLLPAVAAIVAVEVGGRFGARFRMLSVNVRAVLIGCILILPFVFGSLWLVLIEKHGFESRYLHPIYGPVAVFRAAILCAPFLLFSRRHALLRWVPSVITMCAMIPTMWAPVPPPPLLRTWTLTNATKIGLAAANAGWSFEDLVFRLQSPSCGELLPGIAVEGPRLNGTPPAENLQLQVALFDSEPTPAPDEYAVVPLERGQFGVLRSVHSWMEPRGVEVCRQPIDRMVPPSCERLRVFIAGRWTSLEPAILAEARRHAADFSFETRGMVTMGVITVPPPYVTSYRIPVRPRAGEVRDVRLTDGGSVGCRWEFVHADGLRLQNTLPATHVRLGADNDEPGVLVIEKPFGAPPCPAREIEFPYPPCVLETRPGEA